MNLYQPTISGSLTVSGSVEIIGPFTMSGGSISGTSSFAANAGLLQGLDSTSFVGTGSFNTMSSSVSTRVTNIEGNYATTGSNIFLGAQTVCANITSTGTIIAQTLNVQQVTSSVVYSSGSNIFGCALTNTQQFTGSVTMTGSLTVTTSGTSPEFQVAVGGTTIGNALTDVHQVTGSLRATGSGIFTSNVTAGGGNAPTLGFQLTNLAGTSTPRITSDNSDATVIRSGASGAPVVINNFANSAELVRFTNSGNVGIGITSPLSILHICGQSGTTGLPSLLLYGECSSNGQRYGFNVSSDQLDISALGTNARIAFFTGGAANSITERMRITSGGLVGINTTNFGERLNIGCGGAIGWQNTCNCQKWHIQYRGTEDGLNFVESAVADYRLFLKAGGNVGIGTCNPAALLHVETCSSAYTARIINTNTSSDNAGLLIKAGVNTGNEILLAQKADGTNIFLINASGNVGIGCTNPQARLDILRGSGDNLRFIGSGASDYSDMVFYATNNTTRLGYIDWSNTQSRWNVEANIPLVLYTNASERMRITNTGLTSFCCQVGIGAASPIARIHTCTAYNANNLQAVFGNSNGSINCITYDTVIIQADDVTTLKLVERNTLSVDQVFTMSVGDSTARLSTTCALPMQFFVAGNPSACGYNGLSGNAAMVINSNSKVEIGNTSTSGEVLKVTGCSCLDNYISVYSGTIQMFLDADKTNNAGIVGTQSSHPLILRTAGTNKLTISTAGVLDFPGSNSTATSASDSMSFGISGASYAWIQTWASRPLRINELGNNVNAYGTNGYGLVNTTASDVRIKKNITSIENALDKVSCLRGVYYEFDENNSMCMKVPSGKRRVGLIAQEVACILPEALLESQDDSTPISLDYSGMVGLLTKAIQELKCENDIFKTCLGIA